MNSSNKQAEFVRGYMESLDGLDAVDIVKLPGRKAAVPAVNTCILGMAALSQFESLPNADQFLERYQQAPHAIMRLGALSLVAAVNDRFHPGVQQLVALQHDKTVALTNLMIGRNLTQVSLDREWIAACGGYEDNTVSRTHAVYGAFGTAWMVHDMGSSNGTKIALEAGSGYSGGELVLKGGIEIPDFVPAEWVGLLHEAG